MGTLVWILIWIIVILFFICEPGARMTNRFQMFDDELARCDWYLFTNEIQRIYLIFIPNAHQPVNIRSYGGIKCERDTLKQVINGDHHNIV